MFVAVCQGFVAVAVLLLCPCGSVRDAMLVPGVFPLCLSKSLVGQLGKLGLWDACRAFVAMPARLFFGKACDDGLLVVRPVRVCELLTLVWVAVGNVIALAGPNGT